MTFFLENVLSRNETTKINLRHVKKLVLLRNRKKNSNEIKTINFCDCAARFAQLDKRRSAEWEVAGSIPDRTNTQGLKITEESALPLL